MDVTLKDIRQWELKKKVNKIVKALREDDVIIRKECIRAIGDLGDRKAALSILPFLYDEDEDMRDITLESLKKTSWKPSADKYGIEYCLLQGDSETITGFGSKVLPMLQGILKERSGDTAVTAVNALRDIQAPQRGSILVDALASPERKVREIAEKAVTELGDEGIQPLIKNLSSDDNAIVLGALDFIAKLRPPTALSALMNLFSHDSFHIGNKATEVVASFGEVAEEALLTKLKDGKETVVKCAINALGTIGSKKAEDFVLKAIDEDAYKFSAISAAGKIGTERCVDKLIEKLSDKSNVIRSSTAKALGHSKSERAVKVLCDALYGKNFEQDYDGRRSIVESIIEIGGETSKAAIEDIFANATKDLNHSEKFKRHAAIQTIGFLKDARGEAVLVRIINDEEQEEYHQTVAIALSAIGTPLAMEAVKRQVRKLTEFVLDTSNHGVAKEFRVGDLAAIAHPDSVDTFLSLLRNDQPAVRRKAAEGLIRIGDTSILPKLDALLKTADSKVKQTQRINQDFGSSLTGLEQSLNVSKAVLGSISAATDVLRVISALKEKEKA